MNTKPKHTIGFLTVNINNGFGQHLWNGVDAYAKKHNLNVIVVPIHQWPPEQGDAFSTQSSGLQKLLRPGSVDGLIAWTSGILTDHGEVDRFLAKFQPLPTVSLGVQATNIPSLICDNYTPMYDNVSHLIEQCGRNNIAYISPRPKENAEADIRYQAYIDAISAHGLPVNQELIAYHSFTWDSRKLSAATVSELLDKRALQIDAIVGASDLIALGVMDELQRRGIEVPGQIAVTGYDNISESLAVWPALTTVDQMPYTQGWQAGKMLHSLLNGEAVAQKIMFAPQPLIRVSSGWRPTPLCQEQEDSATQISVASSANLDQHEQVKKERKLVQAFYLQKRKIQQTMYWQLSKTADNPTDKAKATTLIDALLNEFQYVLEHSDERFLNEHFTQQLPLKLLNAVSANSINSIESAFQIPFDWFYSYVGDKQIELDGAKPPCTMIRAVIELWRYIKLQHSMYAIQVCGREHSDTENLQAILMDTGRTLLTPFNHDKFAQLFSTMLPKLEIDHLCLARYSSYDHPTDDVQVLLTYENGESIQEATKEHVDTVCLIDRFCRAGVEQKSFIVLPLFFGHAEGGHVGILIAAGKISRVVKHNLSVILGQSVKSSNLLEQLKNQTDELEERVAERTQRLQESNETLTNEIAERKRYEKRLQVAKEAAEAATRAKSQFLATISHEIRTPMNGVIGMTSLLLETEINDEQYDYVETIRRSSESLLTIINDILDFSKTELGHMDIEQQLFNLDECVQEAIDLIAPITSAKDIELIYTRDENVPGNIIGDATRIRQILVNLTSNAAKFTEAGDIMVSIQLKEMAAEHVMLHASVRDTGIGIRPEKIPFLFDPFTQADSSITRRFGGTGLGLSISKRLCEVMGGEMWVDSVSGAGSTFHFTLKVKAPHVAMKVAPLVAQNDPKSVLILDDNSLHREVLAKHIQRFGLQTEIASSIADVKAVLQTEQRFDAVVVDNLVYGIDGINIVKQLHMAGLPKESPIILLVPLATNGLKKRARQSGISFMVAKPVKMKELRSTFAQALGIQHESEHRTRDESSFDKLLSKKYPLNILLAEDNVVNQKVAQHILQRLGYRIDTVSDGIEAVEAVRRQNYDIVLMDVQMPNMDGLETTRRILQEADAAQCPFIIAMTAGAMQRDSQRCFDAGMRDFISKPIQIPKLIEVLTKAAEQIFAQQAGVALVTEV